MAPMYAGKPRPGPPRQHPWPGRSGGGRGSRGSPPARPRFAVPPGDVAGRRRGTPALPAPGSSRARRGSPPSLPGLRGPGCSVPGGRRWVKSVPVPSRTMRGTELVLRLRVCVSLCVSVCVCVPAACLPLAAVRFPRTGYPSPFAGFPGVPPTVAPFLRGAGSPRAAAAGTGLLEPCCQLLWLLLQPSPGCGEKPKYPNLVSFGLKEITIIIYICI